MKLIFLLLSILGLVITSCNFSFENQDQTDLIEVVQLSPDIISDSTVHKPGVFISVADTFLVMVRQNEPMIRIYSTNTNKLLGEFGNKGGGSNDFEAPALIKFSLGHSSEKPMVAIYDYLKGRLSFFDILGFFNNSEPFIFHENVPVNKFGGVIGNVFATSKKYLFVNHNAYKDSEINRFTVLNRETGEIIFVPLFPPTDYQVNEQIKELVFKSLPAYNNEKKLIAAIPKYLGRIDFFNEDLEFQFSSVFRNLDDNVIALTAGTIEKDGQMVNSLHEFSGNVVGYNYTKEYLFLFCSEAKYGVAHDAIDSDKYLRVFNWEGEQLEVLSLNASINSSISYDYINHRLYLYDSSKDDDNLMMYDLPTF